MFFSRLWPPALLRSTRGEEEEEEEEEARGPPGATDPYGGAGSILDVAPSRVRDLTGPGMRRKILGLHSDHRKKTGAIKLSMETYATAAQGDEGPRNPGDQSAQTGIPAA